VSGRRGLFGELFATLLIREIARSMKRQEKELK
jgi:hypothetical protein